jgi:hypothetical protein
MSTELTNNFRYHEFYIMIHDIQVDVGTVGGGMMSRMEFRKQRKEKGARNTQREDEKEISNLCQKRK